MKDQMMHSYCVEKLTMKDQQIKKGQKKILFFFELKKGTKSERQVNFYLQKLFTERSTVDHQLVQEF